MITHIQILIRIDYVAQVYSALSDFLVAHITEVYTMAQFVQLRRIFGSGNAFRCKAVIIACHVGMAVHLKGE